MLLLGARQVANPLQHLRGLVGDLGLLALRLVQLPRDRDSLNKSLGGIKEMGGLPDLLFVIDTNKEQIAIKEARKLGIPVVAILDTN